MQTSGKTSSRQGEKLKIIVFGPVFSIPILRYNCPRLSKIKIHSWKHHHLHKKHLKSSQSVEFLRYLRFFWIPFLCTTRLWVCAFCVVARPTNHQSIDVSAYIRGKQWANWIVLHIRGDIQGGYSHVPQVKWHRICFKNRIPFWDLLLMEENLNQLIGSLPQYLQGFMHPRWFAAFLLSTVLMLPIIKDHDKVLPPWPNFPKTGWRFGKVPNSSCGSVEKRNYLQLCFCPVRKGILTSSQPCCVSFRWFFRLLEFKLFRSIGNKLST